MASDDRELRLNILALPNQQKVIVVMLGLVVFGTLLGIGYNAPTSLFWALAVLLLGLSFRQVLASFEAEVRNLRLRAADRRFAPLEARIAALSTSLGLSPPPILAIADEPTPRVVATWQRRYITVGEQRAHELLALLDDPQKQLIADAVLLHELHHLTHGDHLWIEYARSLLRNGLLLILWFALLLIGIVGLLALVQRSFFTYVTPATVSVIAEGLAPGTGDSVVAAFFGSVEEFERVAAEARQIDFTQVLFNVIANTLPYLLICALLLVIYWQRLLHLREFCADAGAVRILGNAEPLTKAMMLGFGSSEKAPAASRGLFSWIRTWQASIKHRLYSVTPGQRAGMLRAPERLNGPAWKYGLTIGLYLLGLNLIISSTATLMLLGDWPMHFPLITTTALISLYLLTPLVLGQPTGRPLWIALIAALSLHTGTIILSLGILGGLAVVAPNLMIELLEREARNLAWYTRLDSSRIAGDPLSIFATAAYVNLAQIPVVILLSAGVLVIIVSFARRMLTWYRLPGAEQKLMRYISIMIGACVAVVALVILPPLTDITLLRFAESASWGSPFYWAMIGLTLLLATGLGVRFVQLDRQHACRCPCGAAVTGSFTLGKRCPDCGEVLHPWLGVSYPDPATAPIPMLEVTP